MGTILLWIDAAGFQKSLEKLVDRVWMYMGLEIVCVVYETYTSIVESDLLGWHVRLEKQ